MMVENQTSQGLTGKGRTVRHNLEVFVSSKISTFGLDHAYTGLPLPVSRTKKLSRLLEAERHCSMEAVMLSVVYLS